MGVGGLALTVKALVHVERWERPHRVLFSLEIEGDPVQGSEVYSATRLSQSSTDVTLYVRIEGGGPMALMWEALGWPLLPKLANAFAKMLRDAVEEANPLAFQALSATRSNYNLLGMNAPSVANATAPCAY